MSRNNKHGRHEQTLNRYGQLGHDNELKTMLTRPMSTARTENLPETTDIYMYLLTYLLAAYPTTLDDGEESGGKTDDKLTGRDNIRMM